MSQLIQLDMFQDIDTHYRDDAKIMRELRDVKDLAIATKISSDKVRKGLFARHGELAKMYMDIHSRLEVIERNICQFK
jgi:hypothetical protein